MNLSPFTKFLLSLSQISRWNYEVWDAGKTVFSSGSKRSKIHVSEDMRKLSTKVISNGIFQHALSQKNYELYGIPIKNGEEVLGSLLAYAPIRSKESRAKQNDRNPLKRPKQRIRTP